MRAYLESYRLLWQSLAMTIFVRKAEILKQKAESLRYLQNPSYTNLRPSPAAFTTEDVKAQAEPAAGVSRGFFGYFFSCRKK